MAPSLSEIASVPDADLSTWLTRHVSAEIHRALRTARKPEAQIALAHHLLDQLASSDDDARELVEGAKIEGAARLLRSIYRTSIPERPTTPLSASTLLTRSRAEPSLGHELGREIACSDRIDVLSAFITVGGFRAVRQDLERASRRGVRVRVLTTVFTGTTEVEALEPARVASPGAEVRISYDVESHAPARQGLAVRSQLGPSHGVRRLGEPDGDRARRRPRVDGEGLRGGPSRRHREVRGHLRGAVERRRVRALRRRAPRQQRERLHRALPRARRRACTDVTRSSRSVRCRSSTRSSTSSAPSDGSTAAAATSSSRRPAPARPSSPPSTTRASAAHRGRAAAPALPRPSPRAPRAGARTRSATPCSDGAFGELFVDGDVPERWDHVFATIQSARERSSASASPPTTSASSSSTSATTRRPTRTSASSAPSRPAILVGLTATPERSDGKSLLPDFDDRIAAELRLWHALERQLLVPFEYYGVSDDADSAPTCAGRGRATPGADLANVYTGNQARVDLIVEQLGARRRRPRASAHSRSASPSSTPSSWPRVHARGHPARRGARRHTRTRTARRRPRRLREREVNVLFTCDLYNEGVDLPFVDTLLLLRPTQSATLFLQQLGRGLRLHTGKSSCLVLDFIGQHRDEFRFDVTLCRDHGHPPRTSTQGDRGAASRSCRAAAPSSSTQSRGARSSTRLEARPSRARRASPRELRELRSCGERSSRLSKFLEETGRDLEDVYDAGGWTTIRERAGAMPRGADGDEIADMSRRSAGSSTPTSRPLAGATAMVSPPAPPSARADRTTRRPCSSTSSSIAACSAARGRPSRGSPATASRASSQELREVLEDRIPSADDVYPVARVAARTAPTLLAARDRGSRRLRHAWRQGDQPAGWHPQARREARAAVRDTRQVSARASRRRRAIATTQSARRCSTGRPRPPRASRAPPDVATSRARPTAGRSSCSCGPIPTRRTRSSAR